MKDVRIVDSGIDIRNDKSNFICFLVLFLAYVWMKIKLTINDIKNDMQRNHCGLKFDVILETIS